MWDSHLGTLNCALGINWAFVLGQFTVSFSDLFRMCVYILSSRFDLLFSLLILPADGWVGGRALRVWALYCDAAPSYPEHVFQCSYFPVCVPLSLSLKLHVHASVCRREIMSICFFIYKHDFAASDQSDFQQQRTVRYSLPTL